ncbi:hypothetical protein DFH28DRAFT_867025, partial [Melampsora americana]
ELIANPTPVEIDFLRTSAATLGSTQFDWGEALKDSVIGVISSWKYHENSQLGQPTHEMLQPLVGLMKRKVNEKDTPKNIQACPRLLQIAATDPYLTESSIKWPLILESTRYPWDSRHRIFRAFHSMACRTSKSTVWTSEKDIKNKLRTAHKTIHRIFEESVELISYNAKSEDIEIKTVGEHKVAASMVPMSQSIAWAWQQCMMKAMEEQEVKSSKVHPLGISWLQKRFLLVLTGVMLVYERDVYNRQLNMYCKVKRTANQIASRRNELKGSVLHQLSSDYIRKNPIKALTGLKKNQVPSTDALAKVTEKEIQSAANDETFNFRRQAIQALALFLMFGTSGLFHVWVWYREQKMTDAALLIHMSSILAQRRNQASKSEPHVFYQRSWSRLDHHLFTILREFIDEKGGFKRKIDWPQMTRMFHDRFSPTSLSYLYTLDLCLELHAPLSSRGPDGSVAPDFDSNSKNQGQALIPITEPFRSVWASTEGKAVPVTDPQAMYKEADGSRVTKKHPLKTITQAKEKAREEIVPQPQSAVVRFTLGILMTHLFLILINAADSNSTPSTLDLPHFDLHSTILTYACADCDWTFDARHKRDKHRALAHQDVLTMSDIDGRKWTVVRTDGFFFCPQGACGYKSDVPKNFGAHLAICKVAVHPVMPKNDVRVVPLGEDIIASEALSEYGLVWNNCASILICVQCHVGVPVDEVASHRNSDIKGVHVHKEQVLEDLEAYSEIAVPPISPVLPPGYELGKPCEPIQGLKIYDGFGCRLCHRAYPKMKSIREHFRLKHNGRHVLPGHDRSPSPELEPSNAVKLLVSKLDAHAAQSHLVADPEKDSQLSNWLYVSGIHHYIADLIHRGRTVEQIILPSEEIEPIQAMVPYISHWINTTMKRLHQTGQFLKRHCLAETTDVEDNKGLMPLQEQSLVDKYANTLARLMWFMIEESEKKIDSNTQFYNTHVAMLSDLKAAIKSITVDLHQQRQDSTRLRDPEIHDPISGRVSEILCALFQLYCSAAHCQYWLPALQFLARAMLKADKSYDRPDNFTRLIAHIQYGVRMAFAQQFMDNAAEQSRFDPASDPTTSSPDDFSKFDFLHKNKSAPFNIMRQLMHLATNIYMSETMPDSTFWADHHQETLEINNKTVTLSGIRSCIQYQDKMVEANLHEIVKGCKLPHFDPVLYSDKPNNTAPGFNYLVHSELTHKQHTF